ncbi:MAG: hypothetical protein MUO82_07550 [Candidatus Thermoplasmatota archaeon]|nr:hypothetical protein [Candidatus Thermoplasmatota archaeon]
MYSLIGSQFEKNYIVSYEVPLLNSRKKIDVLCLNKNYHKKRNIELIAIEAKVKDRKKVLYQAFTRLSCVDKVYIAIYEKHISDEFLNCSTINKYSIGVMSVNSKAKIIKKAKKSNLLIPSRKERIINNLLDNLD